MRKVIIGTIDWLFPLFGRWMPLQTFRYILCGGGNTVLGLLAYFVGYQYWFAGQIVEVGFYAFKPHMAALFVSSLVSFSVGFLLNKYVVFTDSNLKGRIQLFRYLLSFALNVVINYGLLKCMVEYLQWPAMVSQIVTTILVILMSFLIQKNFSFKINKSS